MRTYLPMALALLFAGCQLPPSRTTTADERTWATILLNKVSLVVALQEAQDKISAEDAARARSQIEALRDRVTASEITPVSWVELTDTLTTFALEWAIDLPPQDDGQ